MQFALDFFMFFKNKSLSNSVYHLYLIFASPFSIDVLDHDIYFWFRPPSHRAVYVILSLNVASIIYCFDESDHDKLRLEEANYREVEYPMYQYESIFTLRYFQRILRYNVWESQHRIWYGFICHTGSNCSMQKENRNCYHTIPGLIYNDMWNGWPRLDNLKPNLIEKLPACAFPIVLFILGVTKLKQSE